MLSVLSLFQEDFVVYNYLHTIKIKKTLITCSFLAVLCTTCYFILTILDVQWGHKIDYVGKVRLDMVIFRHHLSRVRNTTPCTDYTHVGINSMKYKFDIVHGEEIDEYGSEYLTLQKETKDYYAWKNSLNEVQWLKKPLKRIW